MTAMLRSAVLAAVLAHAAADHMRCSAVCQACCPLGLRPDGRGDCVDPVAREPQPVCRLETGKCLGGVAKTACPAVALPAVRLEMPDRSGALAPVFTFQRWLADGAWAWSMLEMSAFKNVPAHMAGVVLTVPEDPQLKAGSVATFTCPEDAAEGCLAFVLVYQCHPCVTRSAGLHAELARKEWERSRCGPHFTTGVEGGAQHALTTYVKTVGAGSTEVVDMATGSEYTVFGMAPGVKRPCGSLELEECMDFDLHGGRCAWQRDTRTCGWNKCRNYGPPTGSCTRCVTDEVPARSMP